jgi:hypothetical protein
MRESSESPVDPERGVVSWAEQQFGSVRLGDARLDARLVRVAARLAQMPAGNLCRALSNLPAEREAAYRLMENDRLDAAAIARSSHEATGRLCAGLPYVFVAEDASSLKVGDTTGARGTGRIGTTERGGRGFPVVTAIAVSPDGQPLGVCGQAMWARAPDPAEPECGESEHWLTVMRQVVAAIPGVRPWFQVDRGADFWRLMQLAVDSDLWLTVRSNHNRHLYPLGSSGCAYMKEAVEHSTLRTCYRLDVPAAPRRKARVAKMELRSMPVTLKVKNRVDGGTHPIVMWLVVAREVETTPEGETPMQWNLLTTYPAETAADCALVVIGYAQRWRIEEFHRCWKSAVTDTESSQLQSMEGQFAFHAMKASVAMRIMRLTYLPRTAPDLPATDEFSEDEIDGVYATAQRRRPRGVCTIAQVARTIADIGGYVGKSSGGPPGPLVVARGWAQVEPVVRALRHLRTLGADAVSGIVDD